MNPILKLVSMIRDVLWRATRHWLSAVGALLTTISSVSFLTIFALELGGRDLGHYTGIISYLILPALFVLGLVLMPVGLALLRRKERLGKSTAFPVFDFNDARLRGIGIVVLGLTVVNLMVISTATFKGLEVLHGDAFCGGTCHTVMQPEAVAHLLTPHARVYCADCHIGEGPTHFAKSKLRGATQMLQFFVGDVARPVPQPTEVPNSICVRCHSIKRYVEDRLHVRQMYSSDEKAVQTTTVWRNLVGGYRDGRWSGVHSHNGMKVRYLADPKRATITEVEVTRADGTTDKYTDKEVKAPEGAKWFEMGCTDCHNRPAHKFSSPESIVEKAISRGALDKELPFIGREAVAALKSSWPTRDAALEGIPAAFTTSYEKLAPDQDAEGKAKVAAAGKLLAEAWTHNNFPDMKVTWGTYTDFFQHEPGCYRCHDKKHENAKGEVIQKKCSGTCHDVIATEEEEPEVMEVLFP